MSIGFDFVRLIYQQNSISNMASGCHLEYFSFFKRTYNEISFYHERA